MTYISEVIKLEGVETPVSLSALEVDVKQMLHAIRNPVMAL